MSFTSRTKECIKFVPHSCLVSLSHKVGVFLEEVICYFIYVKFAVMLRLSINTVVSNHVNSDHVLSFSCLDIWGVWQTTSGVYAISVTTSAFHSRRCGRLYISVIWRRQGNGWINTDVRYWSICLIFEIYKGRSFSFHNADSSK